MELPPLPDVEPPVSLASTDVFVIDEARWREAEWVGLGGRGLRRAVVMTTLGLSAEPLDGVVIDGHGFVKRSFAFRLPRDDYVYGYYESGEVAVLGLHRSARSGEAMSFELKALMTLMQGLGAVFVTRLAEPDS